MFTTADIAQEYGLSERQVRHAARVHGLGEMVDRPDGRGSMRVFGMADRRWFANRPSPGRPRTAKA